MLAIGTALLSGPQLLMVDELSLGLAPRIVGELSEVLLKINRERKMTILLVEQSAAVAFSIAQYVYVLNLGRVTAEGRANELRSRRDFSHSYLGTGRAPGDTGTA
jgi:branched-chain amino acid transport system ATP-binding protein